MSEIKTMRDFEARVEMVKGVLSLPYQSLLGRAIVPTERLPNGDCYDPGGVIETKVVDVTTEMVHDCVTAMQLRIADLQDKLRRAMKAARYFRMYYPRSGSPFDPRFCDADDDLFSIDQAMQREEAE